MKKPTSFYLLSILITTVALTLTACSVFAPPPPPTATPTFTPLPATDTPIPPTPTPIPPTEPPTETPPPTLPPQPTAPPLIQPSATLSNVKPIFVYFLSPQSGMKNTCGSTVVQITTGLARTEDEAQNVKLALQRLFAYKSYKFGNLYNPFAKSSISVGSVEVTSKNIIVNLNGTYTRADDKDKCVNNMAKVALYQTIRLLSGPGGIKVLLNGDEMDKVLANK